MERFVKIVRGFRATHTRRALRPRGRYQIILCQPICVHYEAGERFELAGILTEGDEHTELVYVLPRGWLVSSEVFYRLFDNGSLISWHNSN